MPIPMPLLVKRITDLAVILAVSSGLAFLMIACANSLVTKTGIWKSYAMWLAVISRPDIVVTTLLTIAVTMAVLAWNQAKGRR